MKAPDIFPKIDPSWGTIARLGVGVVIAAAVLTLMVAAAQPLGLLDGLREMQDARQHRTVE